MITLLMICIGHTVVRDNDWEILLLGIAMLLRFNSTFLLYRKELYSVIPIGVFTLLFGYAVLTGMFDNTIFRMGEYPSILFSSKPSGGEYIVERHTTGELFVKCIIYWVWLMPIVVYGLLSLRRATVTNGYRWYDLAGLAFFKDKAGKLFVTMVILLFIAALVGYQMDEMLSFYALMSLPLVAYYHINRCIGKKVHWIEYVILGIALYFYDKSQYKIEDERIAYLAVSSITVFGVCAWMLFKTKQVIAPLLALVMTAVVLPGLSIGYNIYQSLEGARSIKYVNLGVGSGYMYITRYNDVNGKKQMRMGIRDRYRTTIPCQFRSILPDDFYSPFAKCTGEDGKAVTYNIEGGYIH